MRKRMLFSLLVVFLMGISVFAAEVLPPSIMPVLVLSGSDYQMGYQYGQQAGQYIELQALATWASTLQKFSRDEVLAELKASQYFTREYAPEVLEQMEGMVDGAIAAGYEVSFTDLLLINAQLGFGAIKTPWPAVTYPSDAEYEELPGEGCANWSAWGSTTRDGSLISGDVVDATFCYQVVIVAFPERGNSYLAVMRAGQVGNVPAMNNKGLFIGGSGGFANREIDYEYGIHFMSAFHHLIRFADSAVEAKDMLLNWKVAGSWNLHFADVSGDAFVVEWTAAVQNVREPGDFGETDFIYASNTYLTEEMKDVKAADNYVEHAGWGGARSSSICRNLQLWNMFHNYQGEVDLDFAKMLWRFPGEPPPDPPDEGWCTHVGRQYNQWIGILLPADGGKGLAYICTGPAGRVLYPFRRTYYQIAPTYTFYEIALASSPAAVVAAAQNTARSCIAKAHQKMMMLNYTDTGYGELNDLLSLANTEYYQGINANNRALLASKHRALSYFAQAATAFTRAQSHALQVYNALVPPPSSPEELGLQPWGYWEE